MTGQASKTGQATTRTMARQTRRQLLAGGTGALAAVLTAETLARSAPAAAADGDPLVLGQDNTETSTTFLTNQTADESVLVGEATGHGAGLEGSSATGPGVTGSSDIGSGVQGSTASGSGVFGITNVGGTGNAVVGKCQGSGVGVVGSSVGGGTGVLATGKTALQVNGSAVFDRSGIVTVAAGHSTAMKTGIALTAASLVLATIQGNAAGVFVQGVTKVTGSSGSFTVHLNKAVSKSVKVAWFAVN